MPIGQIQQIRIGKLRPNPANVRTHPKKQIAQLARGIKEFGFLVPIVADESYVVQAGHARLQAARSLGLPSVPVVIASGLSDTQRRAFVLADNRLAEAAGWNRPALAGELEHLAPILEEAGLSIDLTGFEPAEIDTLLGDLADPEQELVDDVPDIGKEPVSRRGDLWQLGEHQLLCADAKDEASWRTLMSRASAAMIFTDPPYNVAIASIQGSGRVRHREFLQASGELSPAEFTRFLNTAMGLASKHSADGSIHFWFMDWRHVDEISRAASGVYSELKNIIVWVKSNDGQGSFYKSRHEFIFVYKNGRAAHTNNFELGQHGRTRSNVWQYAGINSFRSGRMDELKLHPTVKPVALVADAMRDCSRRGDVVLDPFMGSGTTILAAERIGRRAYGLEIDPLYVDAAVRRWQGFTKRDAILKVTGQTFDEAADARSGIKPSRRRP